MSQSWEQDESWDGYIWQQWNAAWIIFAFVNGFLEELFSVVLLGLLIRFSFHTYQGIAGALTITTLGVVFAIIRCRNHA